MTRTVSSLRNFKRAQNLIKSHADVQLQLLLAQLTALDEEEATLLGALQQRRFAMPALSRPMARRILELSTRRDGLRGKIEAARLKSRSESTRADRIGDWIVAAEQSQETQVLAEIAEDDTANKLHTRAG